MRQPWLSASSTAKAHAGALCVFRSSILFLFSSACWLLSKLAVQARLLTSESRVALHQLPFYARAVAVLSQAFPDIAAQVVKALEDDFTRLMV